MAFTKKRTSEDSHESPEHTEDWLVVKSTDDASAPRTPERPTASEAIGDVGFGTCIGWFFVCYTSNIFATPFGGDWLIGGGFLQLIGIATFTIMMAFLMVRADTFAHVNLNRALVGTTILGLAVPTYCLVSQTGGLQMTPLGIVAWILNGLSTVFALMIWARFLWTIPTRRVAVRMMVTAVIIAAFWAIFLGLVPDFAQKAGAIVLLVINAICFFVCESDFVPTDFVDREASRKNCKLDMKTTLSLGATSFAQGYVMFLIYTQGSAGFVVIAAALIVDAGVLMLVRHFVGETGVFLGSVLRYMFPVLVIGFIILPFVSGPWVMVLEAMLLAICSEHWCSLVVNVVQVKIRYDIQPLYFWSRTNLPWAAGMTIGWLAGSVVYTVIGPVVGSVPIAPALLVVVVLAVSTAITPYGIDHLTVPEEQDAVGEGEEGAAHTTQIWREACEQIAEEYSLTPRETEIFMLLAKGRNSRIIERELDISVHTIKSHNYNIYRKLDVESQQELIDMVEARRHELRHGMQTRSI